VQATQEQAETLLVIARDRGFPYWVAQGTIYQGWALAKQGQAEEGLTQIQQGLTSLRAIGQELARPYFLALLAEAYGKMEQPKEGLNVLAEVLALVEKTWERWWEAELYRLKGQLTLQKFQVSGFKFQVQESPKSEVRSSESEVPNTQHPTPSPQAEAEAGAEKCFLKAIEIARKQQAKSLELRAVMSLVRLRHQQAAHHASRSTQHEARTMLDAAHNMLSEIYGWFTEGFDTADLQEAKALLESFAEREVEGSSL
jgi:predicted ATPase